MWMYVDDDRTSAWLIASNGDKTSTAGERSYPLRWLSPDKRYAVCDVTLDDNKTFTYAFKTCAEGSALNTQGLSINLLENSSSAKAFWIQEVSEAPLQVVFADDKVKQWSEQLQDGKLHIEADGEPGTEGLVMVYGTEENDAMHLVLSFDETGHAEAEVADKVYKHLESGKPARTCELSDEEREIVSGWFLLTTKPVIYAANIAEDAIADSDSNPMVQAVKQIAAEEKAECITISAAIEEEIAGMEADERQMFLDELGIKQSGLDALITVCYHLLGLISFLTAGADECRAWTIKRGTKAPQAAGKIHTDFERGFIRAEIVPFETLKELGSMNACREKGLIRSEGKDYVMQDGDITLFRFNV